MTSPPDTESSIHLDLPCPTGRPGARHTVTIDRDWRVTTPHDAVAERIAEALGGPLSCVSRAERTVAILRTALDQVHRRLQPNLRRDPGGSWALARPEATPGCCTDLLFGNAADAADHTRSPAHLARYHQVAIPLLADFLDQAKDLWGDWDQPPRPVQDVSALVSEPDGVKRLWRGGIHPLTIAAFADVVATIREPLPQAFYLAMVYGTVDPAWLREVLTYRPDADTAQWLAQLEHPHTKSTPANWGHWLQLTPDREDVLAATTVGLSAGDVRAAATTNGWPLVPVVTQFVKWAHAGCVLKVEHLHALKKHGIRTTNPSRRAIDALCTTINRDFTARFATKQARVDRTELAIMLEISGSPDQVLAWVRQGKRTAGDC